MILARVSHNSHLKNGWSYGAQGGGLLGWVEINFERGVIQIFKVLRRFHEIIMKHCKLKVLISEFLTWSTKTFDILPEIIMEYKI